VAVVSRLVQKQERERAQKEKPHTKNTKTQNIQNRKKIQTQKEH